MNEFTKITPVSIGLLVDEQQFQSGITGACSFSRSLGGCNIRTKAPFWRSVARIKRNYTGIFPLESQRPP